jgi:hypothetical protein
MNMVAMPEIPRKAAASRMLVCFAAGTGILTRRGETNVEALRVGDEVLTMDNGYAAIRWIGKRVLTAEDLADHPEFRPIRIARGALSGAVPDRDLMVSPQHRLLIRSHSAEKLFADREVLVAAKYLTGLPGVSVVDGAEGAEYWHFILDRHEIVFSNGMPSETLFPGAMAIEGIGTAGMEELYALFPELRSDPERFRRAARRFLSRKEADQLFEAGTQA